jgi:hypothetical protein
MQSRRRLLPGLFAITIGKAKGESLHSSMIPIFNKFSICSFISFITLTPVRPDMAMQQHEEF